MNRQIAIPDAEKVRKQFNELYEKGYNELIIIAISSGLGGTYNELRLIGEEYADKMKITVIDSRITAFNEGLLAIKAAEMVEKGVPTEQIVKEIEWIKARQEFMGIDGKLDYLIYNGRLKGGKAFMGKMLSVLDEELEREDASTDLSESREEEAEEVAEESAEVVDTDDGEIE